jgi:hypothetical protein
MNKAQWIKQQSVALGETNPNTLWSRLLTDKVTVPNPVPQGNIPKPFDAHEAFQLIPDAEKLSISETRTYREGILTAISAGNMVWVQDSITTLVTGGKMTASTAQALSTLMGKTIPDPNWKPNIEVPRYIAAGYNSLSYQEVVDALNA